MASLYRHKRHGWQVPYRIYLPDGKHNKRTKYAKKRYDAQMILSDAQKLENLTRRKAINKDEVQFFLNQRYINKEEAQRLTGSHVLPYMSFRDLTCKYERWSRENCRHYTHQNNISKLKVVLSHLEDHNPTEITKENIQSYISKRKREGMRAATINKEIIVMRKLLDGLDADSNPARKVKLLRIDDEKLPRVLTPEEIQIFFQTVEKYKHLMYGCIQPFVMTYLYAGLRASEIINLTPDDINIDKNKIYVQAKEGYRTKTGSVRSVDIHPELKPFLKELLKGQHQYVFGKGNRIHHKTPTKVIRFLIKKAGLKGIVPYSLRHSFCSYLLQSGATIREVMDLAGHRLLKTTQRYLHTIPNPDSPVSKLSFNNKYKQ